MGGLWITIEIDISKFYKIASDSLWRRKGSVTKSQSFGIGQTTSRWVDINCEGQDLSSKPMQLIANQQTLAARGYNSRFARHLITLSHLLFML